MSLRDIAFAPSWWMLLAGLILGVGLFIYGNRRISVRMQRASLGVILLTGVWWLVGYLVVTPTEAAWDGTRAAVDAVVARDKSGLAKVLSPDAALGGLGKDQIVTLLPEYADEFGLKSALILGSDIDERGASVTVTIRVFSQHENAKRAMFMDSLRSEWQFVWRKEADGRKLVQITPTKVGETDVTQVVDQYFSRGR